MCSYLCITAMPQLCLQKLACGTLYGHAHSSACTGKIDKFCAIEVDSAVQRA